MSSISIDITTSPAESGTAIIVASFTDHDGEPVAPNAGTLTWRLTDMSGNVINNRSAVAITSAASVTVVLTGDDLALSSKNVKRVITFLGQYNSDQGNNLPIRLQGIFPITDLIGVPQGE